MKTIWRISIAVWFFVCTILGIGIYLDTPRQIEKDKIFKTKKIDPLVNSVKQFVKTNTRIPKGSEFNKLDTNRDGEFITRYLDLPQELKDKIEIENWDTDTYAIAIWRGEWYEGYISKDDIYILNGYSWTEGLKGLLIIIGIGLLPTLLTLIVSKIKR